jgi:hypothetical protein
LVAMERGIVARTPADMHVVFLRSDASARCCCQQRSIACFQGGRRHSFLRGDPPPK